MRVLADLLSAAVIVRDTQEELDAPRLVPVAQDVDGDVVAAGAAVVRELVDGRLGPALGGEAVGDERAIERCDRPSG